MVQPVRAATTPRHNERALDRLGEVGRPPGAGLYGIPLHMLANPGGISHNLIRKLLRFSHKLIRMGGMIKVKEPAKVGREKRTATPSVKRMLAASGDGREPPRRPVEVASAGEGPKYLPVTVSLDQGLIDRLDEDAHRHRETRSAAARRVLEAGLK